MKEILKGTAALSVGEHLRAASGVTNVLTTGVSASASASSESTVSYPGSPAKVIGHQSLGNYVPASSTLISHPMPYSPWISPGSTLTTTATTAEKAELVLTLLLSKLTPGRDLVMTEVDEHEVDQETAVRGEDVEGCFVIEINTHAQFEEILDALYAQLGNIRGRQLR